MEQQLPEIVQATETRLETLGFERAKSPTKKKSSWRTPGKGQVFYVNRVSKSGATLFILHPEQKATASGLAALPDVKVGQEYYHSSNMNLFPKREHGGQSPIPFGIPVTVLSNSGMNCVVDELRTH